MPGPLFDTILTSQGLNSLSRKGWHILVKNWIFDDPFHKNLLVLVILVPMMIRPSGSGSFLGKLRPLRLQRPLGSIRLERFLRPGKSLQWTSRFLNSIILGPISLYFDVLRNNFLTESWKLMLNFSTLSVKGCWGPMRSKKFQMVDRHKFPLLRNPLSISFW